VRKKIHLWDGRPLEVPIWCLTVFYGLLAVIGATVWLASSPTLQRVSGDTVQAVWGITLAVAALIAASASVREAFEPVERIAAIILWSWLIGFAAAPIALTILQDWDHATYSAIATTLAAVTSVRTAHLVVTTGRPKHG
jgi:hypothetical protein